MKDYRKYEREEFILNYTKKGNQLIVKYADKKEKVFPFTRRREEELQKKMENQIKKADINQMEQDIEKYDLSEKIWACFTMMLVLVNLLVYQLSPMLCFSYIIPAFALSLGMQSYCGIQKGKIVEMIEDVQKNRYFLAHKEIFNEIPKVKKSTSLHMVSKKTKKVIQDIPKGKPIFDFSTIENMSLKDLKQIRENLQNAGLVETKEETVKQYQK